MSTTTAVTRGDCIRAESIMPWNVETLTFSLSTPNWIDQHWRGKCFWYRNRTHDGTESVLVDPIRATCRPGFISMFPINDLMRWYATMVSMATN
ncbi:MAG: hypothetical protein DCC58_01380 [Chloroflexi bacterium]|nr:MAG: hypothetical protein DCC58_01380 [Chloroflexota bacterium]